MNRVFVSGPNCSVFLYVYEEEKTDVNNIVNTIAAYVGDDPEDYTVTNLGDAFGFGGEN